MNSNLQNVNIRDIKVNKRFRKDYGNIDDLVKSIQDKGILQPITLNKNLELMAGGRRYIAAVRCELTTIPALIRDTFDEIDLREVELIENIFRKDLNWDERAKLTAEIDRLQRSKYGDEWSGRKTASLIGRSVGGISEDLTMAKALEAVPELAKCKTENDAKKLLRKVGEHSRVKEARKKQDEEIKQKMGDSFIVHAASHFQIGDALVEIEELVSMYDEMGTESIIKTIEVDPPYAIDLSNIKKQEGGIQDAGLEQYEEISKENYPAFLSRLSKCLYEVAARDSWIIFWFGPTWHTEVFSSLREAGFLVDDIPGIWIKGSEGSEGSGQTNCPNRYLGRAYEPFAIGRKGNPVLRKQGRSNVFSYAPVIPSKKYHPTQRPIELMEEILETFAYPNTVVLVPFLGSGVTLRAAYKQDMNGFGYELNKENKDHFLLSLKEDGYE